jgi:PAS domain S-box-containing protein
METDMMRILYIEDNPGDVILIKEVLTDALGTGFSLAVADRLSSGIDKLKEISPNVLLLDLGLPDSAGIETLTRLMSKSPEAKVIPIVVLTGNTDESLGLLALKHGAQEYMVKGMMDSRFLVRLIRYAIERKKMEMDLRRSNEELRVNQIELRMQAEELRKAQLALELSRDKYLDLYDFAPLGYFTLNDRVLIEEMNLTGATLLGVERSKLVDARFRKFIDPEYFEQWDRYFLNVLNQGQKQSCPIIIKRGDGSTFPARLESIRITGGNKENPTVRVAISDITHIWQVETALRMSNKKLALLNSITRHDIMNQLMVLSGSLENALNTVRGTEGITHISRAQKAAKTIQHQIAFTREYEELGIKAPVWQQSSAVIRSAASQMASKTIAVEIPDERLEIYADPLLGKVFYNLFDNTQKYGGAVTRISISHQPAGDGLVVTVADNGIGLSPDDKKHLFERGFGKHTGLGLFLSREILSITGISVSETGIPGNGARFEIVVPKGAFRFTGKLTPT